MADGIPNSVLRIDGVVFPWFSSLELDEDWKAIEAPESFRTVNKRLVFTDPDPQALYRVSYSAKGNTLFMPDLTGFLPGKECMVDTLSYWTATIQPGQTSVLVGAEPVAGFIVGRTARTNHYVKVATVAEGGVWRHSIQAPLNEPVSVLYRRRLALRLMGIPETSTSVQEATQPWSLTFEMDGPEL